MSALLLLAWAAAAPPRLLELRSETLEGRPSVVAVAAGVLGEVAVRREGPEVVVSLAASAPDTLAAPAAAAPLQSIRLERTAGGVRLRMRVAPDVSYELRRELDRLALIFGARPDPSPLPAAAPPSSTDLYHGLFPPSIEASEQAGGGQATFPGGVPPVERPQVEKAPGLAVGIFTVRPAATLSYVDADVSLLETAQPVRDRYAEARSSVGIELPVREDGYLRLDYQARIRRFSSFEPVNGVSHEANGNLQLPTGPFVTLRGHGHFARGLLETSEVDPGGEYFFRLGRFTRKRFGGGARFNPTGRFDLDLDGADDRVSVAEGSGFFAYERRSAAAALGVEVGPARRASLGYSFEQVPATGERPEAESRIHSIWAAIDGEILPLTTGRISAGYMRRESPRAGAAGQRFRGLGFGAEVRRDFGRAAHLTLSANRSTELSAFEHNAFYLTTSVQSTLTAPLPFSFALNVGGGYHVNRYPTAASALGVPRRDQIVDWLAGLGRSITRWLFVRADYRQDRRDSNLDVFDQRTHAFYVQAGIGFFSEALRR